MHVGFAYYKHCLQVCLSLMTHAPVASLARNKVYVNAILTKQINKPYYALYVHNLFTSIKLNAKRYTYVLGKCGRWANDHTTVIVIKITIFPRARVVHSHAYYFLPLAKYLCQESKIFYDSEKSFLFIA